MDAKTRSIIIRIHGLRPSRMIVSSVSATFLWQVSNYLVPLLTLPYLARVLGASSFGILALATVISSYGILITDWGFALTGTQAVAAECAHRERISRIVWEVVIAKLFLAILSIFISLVICVFFLTNSILSEAIMVSMLILVPTALTLDWLLRGLEKFKEFALPSVIGRFITIPLLLAFVHSEDDICKIIGIQILGSAVTALMTLAIVIRLKLIMRPTVCLKSISDRILGSASIFLSSTAVNIYANSLPLILGFCAGPDVVGLYAGAERIRRAAANALVPLNLVFYPKVVRLISTDLSAARSLAVKTLLVQTLFAGGMCLFGFIFAPWLVLVLLGPQFEGSVPLLRIIVVNLIPVGVSGVLGLIIMIPFGYKKDFTILVCSAGLFGIVLALFLSFLLNAEGAAYASLIAESLVAALMYAVLLARAPWLQATLYQLLLAFNKKAVG